MWLKGTSWKKSKLSIVGESPLPTPFHRPSRKLSGAMAGCSGGSSTGVTPGSAVLSCGVPSSAMGASPDHLDRRVAGGDGDGGVREDQHRRAQHPVHATHLSRAAG